MPYRVDESIAEQFTTGSIGEVITITAATDPDGLAWAPLFMELGSGVYRISFTPTKTGSYSVSWSCSVSGRTWDGNYDVDEDILLSSDTGTSRLTLRRDVLHDLGDLRILRATSNGTNVDFRDALNLTGEPGVYAGREALFTGGTLENIGEIRYVTDSSRDSFALGFGVSLPSATFIGDEAELINTRGTGWRFQETHDAINQAIRSLGDKAMIVAAVSASSYGRGVGISVPPSFRRVEDIQWRDASDTTVWHSIPKAQRATAPGWWLDRFTRTVVINGPSAWTINGRALLLYGLGEPAELLSDSDTTPVNREWIVAQARSTLALGRHTRMPTPETERLFFLYEQRAGQLRGRVLTRVSPFGEEV